MLMPVTHVWTERIKLQALLVLLSVVMLVTYV